jgi:DNA/RNA-binding domain of Phe-tRNA-synthetase-like protein
MTEKRLPQDVPRAARVDQDVFALRPDYRALLITVDGLVPGNSDAVSEALLQEAEATARKALNVAPVTELPHIAAWREAYQSFGAKPNRTRNSLEALLRRAPSGLPRVNRLTDIYNAISVLHQIPLGGEDLTQYQGAPTLLRATGQEPFDTTSNGEPVIDHPAPGEVVWADDAGITCRCWNWRQGKRTQLTDATTTALFILDALNPLTDEDLTAAADHLTDHLSRLGPDITIARRLIASDTSLSTGTPDEENR